MLVSADPDHALNIAWGGPKEGMSEKHKSTLPPESVYLLSAMAIEIALMLSLGYLYL
jgi:hypothetical protein